MYTYFSGNKILSLIFTSSKNLLWFYHIFIMVFQIMRQSWFCHLVTIYWSILPRLRERRLCLCFIYKRCLPPALNTYRIIKFMRESQRYSQFIGRYVILALHLSLLILGMPNAKWSSQLRSFQPWKYPPSSWISTAFYHV